MKALLQSLQVRIRRMLRNLFAALPRTIPAPVRSGWPPLSTTPLVRRRRTDALPWFREGPRDDWKR